MEIFQTIWTALTTENEVIAKLVCSPITFIEAYISMLLFTLILKINTTKKQIILYVLLFSLIALLSTFFIPYPYYTYLNVILCPLLVLIIFKTNVIKAILAEIIPYGFFIVIGSIFVNLYIYIFNLTSNIPLLNVPLYKLIYSLSVYLIIFCFYLLFKFTNFNISLLDKMKKKVNTLLVLNVLIGTIAISIQAYFFAKYINILPLSLNLFSIFILALYFFISIYSLLRTNKLEQTKQNLEEEKLYNKTLTILHDNIRGFKHDFNNIVQAIGGYISTENLEGLKEYYNELLDDCQRINNLSILNPDIINNPAIYSLLTSKYHVADELGIKINLEVILDLNSLNIKIYELSRILGILIDNAIEASKECNKKIINITMRNDNKLNRNLIILENTYKNKDINLNQIFEKGYTSKQKEIGSHGLGLWEVRQILKKNNNLNLHTTKDNKFFKQQLEIYN